MRVACGFLLTPRIRRLHLDCEVIWSLWRCHGNGVNMPNFTFSSFCLGQGSPLRVWDQIPPLTVPTAVSYGDSSR